MAVPDADIRSASIAAVDAAIAGVLGLPGALRGDTPLAAVGVDSLARILVADHCMAAGWEVDESALATARTLAEAAACLTRAEDGDV